MKDFIKRLTSRKFLIAVGTALVLIANQQWNELVILVTGYIASEGAGDAVARFQAEKTKQATTNLEDTKIQFGVLGDAADGVNRGDVVAGNDVPIQ